jgi:hypothetical protein
MEFRKSSYSTAQGNCVEVASLPDGSRLVRDTKDRDGGTLRFPAEAWRSFSGWAVPQR